VIIAFDSDNKIILILSYLILLVRSIQRHSILHHNYMAVIIPIACITK